VVIGLREGGPSYKAALADGWTPGVDLLPVAEAARVGSVIMYLLSDAGQKDSWPALRPLLVPGKTLYFSHGFSVVFHKDTGVVPPPGIDVVLVAPKGSGLTLRTLFQEGKGLNSSVAVWQDASGKAEERAYALAAAVGSGYMYPTTFEKEVYSDLTGERGILMGAIQGLFRAQYDVLRAKGHSPSEAFNETVEEATQSLYPLIGAKGMDCACCCAAASGAHLAARAFSRLSFLAACARAPPPPTPPPLVRSLARRDVRQLLHHGAARRAGLARQVLRGDQACL
jgi:ketol-acid reductoisomerase